MPRTASQSPRAAAPQSSRLGGRRLSSAASLAARLPEARRVASVETHDFQLATRVKIAPAGDHWLHEVKFDGYRVQAVIDGEQVRLITRGVQDWTARYSTIARALRLLDVRDAVLDGELIALDSHGRSSFQLLQKAYRQTNRATLQLQLFDLLQIDGWDITRAPLVQRKAVLRSILHRQPRSSPIRLSEHHRGDGSGLLARACGMGLEGLVSKLKESPYVGGRTRSWVKSKCGERQEFVVGGFTSPRGSRAAFGALLLGCYSARGDFVYCGRVGTGFDDTTLRQLGGRLRAHQSGKCPFTRPPSRTEAVGAHWVKPRFVVEVQFAQWTSAHRLRQPVFVGLRDDKKPRAVGRETPKR